MSAFANERIREHRRVSTRTTFMAMLASLLSVVLLIGNPGTAAAAPPAKRVAGTCSVSIDGKRYTAEATLRHSGGRGSSYYVSKFKTHGPPISSVRFTLWQAFEGRGEPLTGFADEIGAITAAENLRGNTAYILPPAETGYATVWVSRNDSLNGDPREKVALLRPFITAHGRTAACWISYRQPYRP